MRPATWTELHAAAERVEAVLCDWDGCLAIDDQLQAGVADFLRHAGRVAIVSNNSTMTRAECRARLLSEGVQIAAENIHLAVDTLLREAARHFAGRPVQLIAAPTMQLEARHLGLRLNDRAAEAVLLMRDPGFDYGALRRAANHVRNGAAYWIANPDNSHPSGDEALPETGALAAAITAAAGRGPDHIVGKPQPLLFKSALAALDLPPSRVLMIGDNPATDLNGARKMAIEAMLVGPASWACRDASGEDLWHNEPANYRAGSLNKGRIDECR